MDRLSKLLKDFDINELLGDDPGGDGGGEGGLIGGGIGGGVVAGQIINGILNLVGKWIESMGQAINAAQTDTPAGVAALVGYVAINVTAIVYFTTTWPYSLILKKLKLYDLLSAIANQMKSIANDVNSFLQQPATSKNPLTQPPIPIGTFGTGDFCMTVSPKEWAALLAAFTSVPVTASGRQCFATAADRDAAIAAINNNPALNWYWVAST